MGGLGGQKCKSLENLPNGWTDWHQISYTSTDSSRNGHRLKTISPSIHQGAFGGGGLGVNNSKVWKIYQTIGTDWHQIWYTSADSYGNGHRLKTNSPSSPGSFWGLGVQNVIKSLRNAMICREKMKINYMKMKCTNRHNYAATIPGEAG